MEQSSRKTVAMDSSVGSDFAPARDLRIELKEALQTSRELEGLLRLFFETARQAIRMDGIAYSHEDRAVEIKVGSQSLHSCGYRLITPDENLGEIIFKRTRNFSELDLNDLELLLPVLLQPLREALKQSAT